jgi:uncharacterized protein
MQPAEFSALTTQVLWAAFILSIVFGAIAQHTHFCTMGALSDAANMGDWTRLRQWALAVGIAMIGFAALVQAGWIDPARTLYASRRWLWLSALVGGGFFGFGMVLASGCGSKTLVRVGAGSLKALVVFVVMGIAAYATLRGITAVLRVNTVDLVSMEFATGADLPSLAAAAWGLNPALSGLVLGIAVGGGLVVWAMAGRDFLRADNLLAGLGVGGVVVAMWWVSGHLGFVHEHPQTLDEVFVATNSGRAEALTFSAPMAYALDWLILFSDKSKVLTTGVVSVAGVVLGSALVALTTGTFRWEGFGGTEDLANHMAGGVLMGIGGVTAMGCTIGQGLSGLSTLSVTSFVAVAGIVAGAMAAFRYQMWRVDRISS